MSCTASWSKAGCRSSVLFCPARSRRRAGREPSRARARRRCGSRPRRGRTRSAGCPRTPPAPRGSPSRGRAARVRTGGGTSRRACRPGRSCGSRPGRRSCSPSRWGAARRARRGRDGTGSGRGRPRHRRARHGTRRAPRRCGWGRCRAAPSGRPRGRREPGRRRPRGCRRRVRCPGSPRRRTRRRPVGTGTTGSPTARRPRGPPGGRAANGVRRCPRSRRRRRRRTSGCRAGRPRLNATTHRPRRHPGRGPGRWSRTSSSFRVAVTQSLRKRLRIDGDARHTDVSTTKVQRFGIRNEGSVTALATVAERCPGTRGGDARDPLRPSQHGGRRAASRRLHGDRLRGPAQPPRGQRRDPRDDQADRGRAGVCRLPRGLAPLPRVNRPGRPGGPSHARVVLRRDGRVAREGSCARPTSTC